MARRSGCGVPLAAIYPPHPGDKHRLVALAAGPLLATVGAMSKHSPQQNPEQGADQGTMPSAITGRVGFFDKFAGAASTFASRAPFFAGCVLLIAIWAPSISVFNLDTWQLIINTATTIITFLMVALLQNSQTRTDQATQHKLNAIADGLADLMAHLSRRSEDADLDKDLRELRLAVGLEDRETTKDDH
jgi:hypothetical protein